MNEIGEKLKEARKEKGYTLDDLQQITKIQKRYLVAVEEGKLEVLPGSFYARAFIKQYADSVGLDGEELIKEHVDTLPKTDQTNYVKNATSTQTRSRGKSSGFLATLQDSLPTILIVLLVVAIIVAIYLAMSSVERNADDSSFIQDDGTSDIVEVDGSNGDSDAGDDSSEEDPDPDTETTDPVDDTDEDIEEEALTIEETDGTTNSTTYSVTGTLPEELEIKLTANGGDTWVSVEVDGAMAEQGLVANGQTLIATLDSTVSAVIIVIGNAGATEVTLNGEPLPYGAAATEAVRQEMYINFE